MLTAVIDAFLRHSAQMDRIDRSPRLKLNRERIAKRVFGDKGSAKVQLSQLERIFPESVEPRRRVRLTGPRVEDVLQACRELLKEQHQALRAPHSFGQAVFEAALCRRLRLPGPAIRVEDFDIDPLLATISAPEQLGLPDLIRWNFAEQDIDMPTQSARGLEVLRGLSRLVPLVSDDHRRLDMLYVAFGLGLFHPCGTAHHDEVMSLCAAMADAARLHQLQQSRDEGVALKAFRMETQLAWCALNPHLRSPTNYLPLILSGRRMQPNTWRKIDWRVARSVEAARDQLRVAPGSPRVLIEVASALTMQARFYLCVGPAHYRRDAEELDAEAKQLLERADLPYGFVFPILAAVHDGHPRVALERCEGAIACLLHASSAAAADAFMALHLELASLSDGRPTTNMEVIEGARRAISTEARIFQFSHVFDSSRVRSLLGRSRPSRRPRP